MSEPIPPDLQVQIPGEYPDAVKAVKVVSDDARALADLGLHKSDLRFALDTLDSMNCPGLPPRMQEALWRCAIVHLYKCFQFSKSRVSLKPDDVFAGLPGQARLNYDFFRAIRDKQLVHDENSSTQSAVIAFLNNGTKPYKVEAVRSAAITFGMLGVGGERNVQALREVIRFVQDWVDREFDKIEKKIHADLEKLPYGELNAMPAVTTRVPTKDEAKKNRPR